ncbi:glycosyltransferase family 4 protein [Cupriavidus sp. 2TAF22]|uniref:glycosyltransferase family 4 protein n=1 Tax=unclassified Cupriavidus TaxID=2640874 RepID=UPI003F93072F
MRILHLVLTPRLSGAEMLAKDLAIHQQAYGDTVCVSALMPQQDDFLPLRAQLDAAGVRCMFPDQPRRLPGRLWHLRGALRAYQPDIIFAHATIPAFYARALPSRVPVVYVMHSAANDFESKLFRCVERLLSTRARAVIGVSQGNLRDYIGAVGEHPLMAVIPNGVDTSRFFIHPAATREAPGDARAPLVVQVGRYAAIKNQLQTVLAFREALQSVPGARLEMYGVIEDPAYYAEVCALVSSLGLVDRVWVNGPQNNVPELLAAASVFAMPSASEAHSIAFLEALATGVPVVASAIPAFAFARDYPGVQLLDTGDAAAYGAALTRALAQPRVARPLDGLTLNDTAGQYRLLARRLLSSA